MDGRPTFFMNTVFALDQSFSRTNTLKSHCQSSSLNTETKKIQKTFRAAVADRRRSCSPRGAHALLTPPRHASAPQKKARACPTQSPAPFASLSPSPRAAPSHSRPPLPAEPSSSPSSHVFAKTRCPVRPEPRHDPLYHLHRSIESVESW